MKRIELNVKMAKDVKKMWIDKQKIVWIPCVQIDHPDTTEDCIYVQPIDGREHNRLWSSNFKKTNELLSITKKEVDQE